MDDLYNFFTSILPGAADPPRDTEPPQSHPRWAADPECCTIGEELGTTARSSCTAPSPLVCPKKCCSCQNPLVFPKEIRCTCQNSLLSPAERCCSCQNSLLSPAERCCSCQNSLLSPAERCCSCQNSLFLPSKSPPSQGKPRGKSNPPGHSWEDLLQLHLVSETLNKQFQGEF